MANNTRNTKSNFALLAAENALKARQVGQGLVGRNLTSLSAAVDTTSEAVQSYTKPMLELIRSAGDDLVTLKKISDIIEENDRLAQTEDPSLTEIDKKDIHIILYNLVTLIRIKTNILSRIAQKVSNVMRNRVSGALQSSGSVTFKLIGKLLAGRDKTQSNERKKSLLSGRSDVYQNVADRQKASFAENEPESGRSLGPLSGNGDEDENLSPSRSSSETSDSGHLLGSILTELKGIYTLLHDEREDSIRSHEQAERDADNNHPLPVSASLEKKESKKSGGLLGGLLAYAKTLLSGGWGVLKMGLLTAMRSAVIPALTTLGTAIVAVAGSFVAFAAAFKAARWFDKLTNGAISDIPGKGIAAGMGAWTGLKEKGLGGIWSGANKGIDDYDKSRDFQKKDPNWHDKEDDAMLGMVTGGLMGNQQPGTTVVPPTSPAPAAPRRVTPAAPSPSRNPAPTPAPAVPNVSRESKLAPAALTISSEGLAKLQAREQFIAEPQWDVNGWAIGYGQHTFHGQSLGTDRSKKPNIKITRADANADMLQQIQTYYEPLVRRNLKVPVSQRVFDSLISVAWNLPKAGMKLAQKISKGQTPTQADYESSATVHGQRNRGLMVRRADEYKQAFNAAPTPTRSAAPVATLTAANQTAGRNTTVIAPSSTVISGGRSGQSGSAPSVVPIPVRTENPDASLRAIQSINGI